MKKIFMALMAVAAITMTSCVDKHGDAMISWSVESTGVVSGERAAILHIYDSVFTASDQIEKTSGCYGFVRNASSAPTPLAKSLAAKADEIVNKQIKLTPNSAYTAKVTVEWFDAEMTAATYTYKGDEAPVYKESDMKKLTGKYTFKFDGGIAEHVDFYALYSNLQTGKLDSVLVTPNDSVNITSEGPAPLKNAYYGWTMVRKAGVDSVTTAMERDFDVALYYEIYAEFNDGVTKQVDKHDVSLVDGKISSSSLTKLNGEGIRHFLGNHPVKWDETEQIYVYDYSGEK